MSKQSEAVKKWRKTSKRRIIESMGGECQNCGYNKCDESLELHHTNPKEKKFGFGAIRANPKSWDKIVRELRKCILLCANCHREFHNGILELPDEYKTFNEEYVNYKGYEINKIGDVVIKEKKIYKKDMFDKCSICNKDKPITNKYCSLSCAGKNTRKVDWDNVNLKELLDKFKSYVAVGKHLGISDQGVKKRAKKIGLI